MDGLALTSECTLEPVEQNLMHNGYIVTLWLTIYLHVVQMVKYFVVQLIFPIAGMMDQLPPIFCHTFETLAIITF
jgi:hypothetical protein